MSKTTFLVTEDNPQGWTLEDILTEIQNDIVRRSQKIVDDARPAPRGTGRRPRRRRGGEAGRVRGRRRGPGR